MIEIPKTMPNGVTVIFCQFAVDETYSMAKFVMDCLCVPWIDNYAEFHEILLEIFYRSVKGKDITAKQAIRLANKYERYYEYGLPQFPKIKNGGRLMAPKDLHGTDVIDYLIKEKTRIWHEVWENHEHIRRKGGIWKLQNAPLDEQYIIRQATREENFWNEVDVKQSEYNCSRRDAIITVSDYMPRAESELQLSDPNLDD